MRGIIPLDIFNLEVAVFGDDAARVASLKEQGVEDAEEHNAAALSSAHLDYTVNGEPRLSMVIKPVATRATWAHECTHVADFVCSALGVPLCMETTEVRAYLVGHMMARLEDIMGGDE